MAYLDQVSVNYNTPKVEAANTAPSQSYQDRINQQLNAVSAPTTANSATVTAQTEPFRLATQRGLQDTRARIAEQNYAGGNTNTGEAQQQGQRASENAAQSIATNTGNVVGTAEAQRLAKENALLGLGTNASLQQQGITNQANQYGGTLGLNYAQLGEAHNAGAAQLGQRASEFGVTSGQNQQAINNALEAARAANALGYYNTNTGAEVSTRGQDINAASSF